MRVAFVSPFYGARAAGGAESECRQTAIHLARRGIDVEILTTCLLDLNHDWNINYYKQGTYSEDGLTVRRFRAEAIDKHAFARLDSRIKNSEALSYEEERQHAALFINSFGLYRYLEKQQDAYDWFCFIPYLFGTTHFGSSICPGKSILIPCLHDEAYARLQTAAQTFERASRIVFHTESEMDIARKLYGIREEQALLIGEGVETGIEADADRFRQKYMIDGRFLLYAGRKDQSKNTPLLLDLFAAFSRRNRSDMKLVLIGPGALEIPARFADSILDLGYIPLQDKYDAYAAANALCQPSLNESFSLVMMESWLCGTPCIVHAECAATREHVVKSGGGLFFEGIADFEGILAYMAAHPESWRCMGEAGRNYVLNNYAWEHIMRLYLSSVLSKD